MTVAEQLARGALRRSARVPFARSAMLPWICAAALEIGAGIHFELAVSHAGTNFGTLSLFAAIAQLALGFVIATRGGAHWMRAALTLQLVLAQLYAINVTIGLPPVIAHVHVGGVHEVLGLVLAVPGLVDLEGIVAVATEIGTAIACAALLLRSQTER